MNRHALRGMSSTILRLCAWGSLAGLCPAALAQTPQSLPGLIVTVPPPLPAGQSPAPPAKEAAKPAPKAKPKPAEAQPTKSASLDTSGESSRSGSGLAIAVIVNGDPITGYQIDQRARLLALSAGGSEDLKAKAEARWAQIVNDPKTNERLQALLRERNVKSREEAQAVQKEYVMSLQRNMIEQIKREARSAMLPKFRKEAQEELIDERLKLQEAKRVGVTPEEAEVEKVVNMFAERNKMTPAQFAEHFQKMGINIETLKSRFRAQLAWTDVIRRKFSMQVNITQRDIDQAVSGAGGADQVELQLHRIVLSIPPKLDQRSLTERFVEAEAIRKRFSGCQTTAAVAAKVAAARFENLGARQASSISEPTRSFLLNAKDGEMIPPDITADGVELLAVCGRKVTRAQEEQRTKKEAELRQKEFEILARRHLRDLRQDAVIEHR